MVSDLWLVDFDPFCVSVFQGSLLVIVIMIDGWEKRNRQLAFELKSEKRSKCILVLERMSSKKVKVVFVEFSREMQILMKLLKCGDADFKLVFQSYCFYSTYKSAEFFYQNTWKFYRYVSKWSVREDSIFGCVLQGNILKNVNCFLIYTTEAKCQNDNRVVKLQIPVSYGLKYCFFIIGGCSVCKK